MHYYKVPRLGSFMAVPLVYNSCLFDEALDNAVADYLDVQRRREEQEKAKIEYEEERLKEKEEREKSGDANYEPEVREFPPIEEKSFDTFEEKYVVCLDSLG